MFPDYISVSCDCNQIKKSRFNRSSTRIIWLGNLQKLWSQILRFHPCAPSSFIRHLRVPDFYKSITTTALDNCTKNVNFQLLKDSENLLKQNKNMLKNMKVLLYAYIYNVSLNVLRPTIFKIYIYPFHAPNIGRIRVKIGPKNNYFSYFMSSGTNKIAVFNIFFHYYAANQETNKTAPAIFLFSNIFWIIYF